MSHGSVNPAVEVEQLRRENERLKQDAVYLTKNYEELMAAQNDDMMIGLLKNKINALENLLDENEKEYEAQIHVLKKKANEQQRESNNLRSQIKELEYALNAVSEQNSGASFQDGKGPVRVGGEAGLERKLREQQEQLRFVFEVSGSRLVNLVLLRKLTEENNALENRLEDAMRRLQQSEIDSFEQSDMNREPFMRKNIRKRPEEVDKKRQEEFPQETLNAKLVEQTNEVPTLKKMINEAMDEKSRVDKINLELNRKVMTLMKTFEEEKDKEITKEKKKTELATISLKRELEETKRQKEDNEKKLFNKIIVLEKKVNEREQQLKLLGDGIESLKRELQLREDPSHSAVQVVQYLEKFAKYQQEFVSTELKRFQDETVQTKNEGKKREEDHQVARTKQVNLSKEFETLIIPIILTTLKINDVKISNLMSPNKQLINKLNRRRCKPTSISKRNCYLSGRRRLWR